MSRLVIVSNRLPITIESSSQVKQARISTGGLVSALRPLLRRSGGCWIGAAEADHDAGLVEQMAVAEGFEMAPIFLPQQLQSKFYNGFCNEILWPLFHDLQSRCNFEPSYWQSYVGANCRFASEVSHRARTNDFIWVHDYHLMLLGSFLKQNFDRRNVLYFHHIPFPPPDVFEKLPWRQRVLEALLDFGLVGFQSSRDQYNFVACVRRLVRNAVVKKTPALSIVRNSNETVIGTFPIGIDFRDFSNVAVDPDVMSRAEAIRQEIGTSHVIVGVDRLDYTKGILERVKGFCTLLERYPGLQGRVSLVQIAVPSRQGVPPYADLKKQLEKTIASINARFGSQDWIPIHYLSRHLLRPEVVAYYRAADIALITPVRDGMNLVCKEFCASRVDETGVLILSEFAGAADQLRTGALLVNPYDAEGIAKALYEAIEMNQRNASRRMRRMRNVVRFEDVFRWCGRVFESLGGKKSPGRIDSGQKLPLIQTASL